MNIGKIIKSIDTAIAIGGTVATAYQAMYSVFRWYEEKYGKKRDEKPITRPIIRGGK